MPSILSLSPTVLLLLHGVSASDNTNIDATSAHHQTDLDTASPTRAPSTDEPTPQPTIASPTWSLTTASLKFASTAKLDVEEDEFTRVTSNNISSPTSSKSSKSSSIRSRPEALVANPTHVIASPTRLQTTASPTPLRTAALSSPSTPPPIIGCGNNGNWKNKPECLHPFGECKGDCDNDEDCAGDLVCYQRGRNEAVPGCNGGELIGSLFDYCIQPVSTSSPTVSISPSISTVPTVSLVPSCSPSISASPTLLPSIIPSSTPTISAVPTYTPKLTAGSSNPVRLRLYWEEGYYWQESTKEKWWCMQCKVRCTAGTPIEIDRCDEGGIDSQTFQYYDDGTYRPKDNPGLCFTEEGLGSQNDPIRLRACETGDIRQKWVNDKAFNSKLDRDKNKAFQIKSGRNTNYCLTQQHHPKAHEAVFPQKCSRAENHDTSEWIVY